MKNTQIGTISLRDPEGNFLSAMPIYRKKADESNLNEKLAKVFSNKYEEYQKALATSKKI
jgi:hypothetical protein